MLIAALAAGLILAQASAPEAPSAPAPTQRPRTVPPVTISDKPPKPKLICERETSTDSFISRRVCRTPEEVEAMRKAAREQTRGTQDFYRECRGRSC